MLTLQGNGIVRHSRNLVVGVVDELDPCVALQSTKQIGSVGVAGKPNRIPNYSRKAETYLLLGECVFFERRDQLDELLLLLLFKVEKCDAAIVEHKDMLVLERADTTSKLCTKGAKSSEEIK